MRITVVALSALVLGLIFLYLGDVDTPFWSRHKPLPTLLENMGGLLVASVCLGILWELIGKRAFVAEVLEATRVGVDVQRAGLSQVAAKFLDVDYKVLFRKADRVDVFVVHGNAWLSRNRSLMEGVASKPGALIRIFLSDPQASSTIEVLAEQVELDHNALIARIESSRREFESLLTPGGAKIETFYYPGNRTHAMYRIGDSAVITFYPHRRGKTSQIPSLVCRDGGALYAFVCADFKAIEQMSRRCGPDLHTQK
ncbi:hypothetical protein ACFFWC_21770 [Plantactinospora siamensis]|uniref:Uncharacterized protein n=1 Tax=Plantactinospora siamensis TaxID=555372 RepID=A0ABV6P5D6_9ACTN